VLQVLRRQESWFSVSDVVGAAVGGDFRCQPAPLLCPVSPARYWSQIVQPCWWVLGEFCSKPLVFGINHRTVRFNLFLPRGRQPRISQRLTRCEPLTQPISLTRLVERCLFQFAQLQLGADTAQDGAAGGRQVLVGAVADLCLGQWFWHVVAQLLLCPQPAQRPGQVRFVVVYV